MLYPHNYRSRIIFVTTCYLPEVKDRIYHPIESRAKTVHSCRLALVNIALFPDILMNSPLILLDVDETLVDIDYKLTCPASEWHAALRRAEARGAIIGLNSDSAYDTLQKRAVAYGIGGPVVAGRGG